MTVESLIQPAELRSFASHFATGVAVVTTRDAAGAPFGLTMNAVTSLSLNPPLLLVCLQNDSTTLGALNESHCFGLHYLATGQQALSALFSTKAENKFAGLDYAIGMLGCPILSGVVAASECEVVNRYPGGDHTIIVGAVRSIIVSGGQPLVYHRGQYFDLADQRRSA